MDHRSNDEIDKKLSLAQWIVELVTPGLPVDTPFHFIQEWLHFLCAHEQRAEPVSEYVIAFSEPPYVLASLVGYHHGIKNGVPASRIVFQPRQYMWLTLPEDEYRGLTRGQFVDKVHTELKAFFTTEQFKSSFLALGYNISTNSKEDIWSL